MKIFKRGMKNIIFGVGGQLITLALGIVLPRMFIMKMGSEVNGLFGSINTLITYIALLEAGLGSATVQALYNPVANEDKSRISSIISATKIYYRKVSAYYLACVIGLSLLYPILVDTSGITKGFLGISDPLVVKISVGAVTLLAGLVGVINFYFQATLKQLMAAEGRNYVNSNISLIVEVALSVVKIVLIQLGADIVMIQLGYFTVRILQMVLYMSYFKRHYQWVDFKAKPDFKALNQRNAYLFHQVTNLIFSSTDNLILTFFDLALVSIYNVYNHITVALHHLCATVNNSLSFVLGITYHKNKGRYLALHDAYNTYYITFIFSMMSLCFLMFRPFILLYTDGADINYDLPGLALLFCLIQMLSATRMVSNNLISIAGHMKSTIWRTVVEAVINLTVSISLAFLMPEYRVQGVLLGTVVALFYRLNDIIIYTERRILHRNPLKTYKPVVVNFVLFGAVVWLEKAVDLRLESYLQFVLYGVIYAVTVVPIYFIVNSICSPKEFKFVFDILKSKLGKKSKA